MEILMIAKKPPPIGGVTIHVQRLVSKLPSDKFKVTILDYSRNRNPLNICKKLYNADLIHIHLSNKIIRFIFATILKILRKKVLITFHGKYDFKNFYDLSALRLADKSIILNRYSFDKAIKLSNKIVLIGAFIPPSEETIRNFEKSITDAIKRLNDRYEIIFSANASSYVLDEKGEEIYMGSKLIKFFTSNPQYALIFSDPSGTYSAYFRKKNIKIPLNVLIIDHPHDFIEVLKRSNALIRATTKDGDSLSVKEALYYKIPVFATDCVDRPNGVHLFKDFDDLKKKFNGMEVLKVLDYQIEDNSIVIGNLYTELLSKNS